MKNLTLIIILLGVLGLGCRLPDFLKGSGSNSGSSGRGGSGSVSPSSDPKDDVVQASKKFLALPFFTANMHGVGDQEIKSQVAYVAPDRYHVKYTGGTGAGMELIWIGKDSYMNANGKWTKMPGPGSSIPTLRDSFTEEGLKTLTDVKYEGEDKVDGKAALVYSYKNVTPAGAYPFTSKIWVDESTGVPIKIFVEYTNGTLKHMMVNYDTETPVTIEPPKS